jgi:hypothetical protein
MSKGSLFVAWGALIPGREEAAGQVLGGAVQYLQQLQQAGRIDSFEVVVLEPHGGKISGFVLLTGDKDAVAQLRVSDEFLQISVQIQMVHSDVSVIGAYTGAEAQSFFAIWDQQSAALFG